MAKPALLEKYDGPRVPVRADEIASRIARHLVNADAKQRLVRFSDGWILVDISQGEPVDIAVLGRKIGVLADCEAVV